MRELSYWTFFVFLTMRVGLGLAGERPSTRCLTQATQVEKIQQAGAHKGECSLRVHL